MDWGEAKHLRGSVVTGPTGEPVGTLVGPYVMEGKLQGYAVDLNDFGRRSSAARARRVIVGATHVQRVADRTFRLDAGIDDAVF